jgi:hypothetical protein
VQIKAKKVMRPLPQPRSDDAVEADILNRRPRQRVVDADQRDRWLVRADSKIFRKTLPGDRVWKPRASPLSPPWRATRPGVVRATC